MHVCVCVFLSQFADLYEILASVICSSSLLETNVAARVAIGREQVEQSAGVRAKLEFCIICEKAFGN